MFKVLSLCCGCILHIHVLFEPLIKNSINYSYLQKTIDFEINNEPASHDTILDACKSVMDYSIKTGTEKKIIFRRFFFFQNDSLQWNYVTRNLV